MAKQPVVLIIRDGWGHNPGEHATAQQDANATLLARTPFHERMAATSPHCQIRTSGEDVGLPDGQMGNSEVGHLNLGAGRVVYQDLTRIGKAIRDGELATNPVLAEAFAKARGHRLHLVGLVSDGGVHSHQEHIVALAETARNAGVTDIFVHAITDGRDTSPTGGQGYLAWCEERLAPSGAKIATVVGRYYAMDRDKRWERTKIGWDAIVHGRGEVVSGKPSEAVARCYAAGTTDEFLLPMIFAEPDAPRVRDGDVVLWFNFRADRARQLSDAFLRPNFSGFDRGAVPSVHYVTLTEYDETYPCPVVFAAQELNDVLGEVVSRAGKTQLRIAETEKYPHVSYFFNGGMEQPFLGEERALVPSPKVATYDLQPEMSAPEITALLLDRLPEFDLVILNFANPDMVGHTGILEAAIRAVETVDECLSRVVARTLELDGHLLITADHGNCEYLRNPDGSPHTAHTTFPVDLFLVCNHPERHELRDGRLADVAPTILELMGLEKPAAMTGVSLLVPRSVTV